MKKAHCIQSRSLLCATAAVLTVLMMAASTPATAQSSDAAERCTPDVMRLCSEFVPDAGRITSCLKSKRRQLSPACAAAFKPTGGSRKKRVRRHRR